MSIIRLSETDLGGGFGLGTYLRDGKIMVRLWHAKEGDDIADIDLEMPANEFVGKFIALYKDEERGRG